jgi:predicted nucleic acid-binding protein
MANQFQTFGLRVKDALHCACAVSANANYFVTTDKQLLKAARNIKGLHAVNPLTFIQEEGNS